MFADNWLRLANGEGVTSRQVSLRKLYRRGLYPFHPGGNWLRHVARQRWITHTQHGELSIQGSIGQRHLRANKWGLATAEALNRSAVLACVTTVFKAI